MKRPYLLVLKKGDRQWRFSRFAYRERAESEGRRLVRLWGEGYEYEIRRSDSR